MPPVMNRRFGVIAASLAAALAAAGALRAWQESAAAPPVAQPRYEVAWVEEGGTAWRGNPAILYSVAYLCLAHAQGCEWRELAVQGRHSLEAVAAASAQLSEQGWELTVSHLNGYESNRVRIMFRRALR